MNAAEIRVDDSRQRFHRQRLRGAGHAFDQRVAFGQQGHQYLLDGLILADDYFAEFAPNVIDGGGDVFNHMFCIALFV